MQFSSAGSIDPEGTSLTYAWDFDGDGTTDSTAANPTHTYTTNGAYTAKLTVTDQAGPDRASTTSPITVGNRAPMVTIDDPEGRPVRRTSRDTIPYKITVTDPEDGTTGAGIDCADVTVEDLARPRRARAHASSTRRAAGHVQTPV